MNTAASRGRLPLTYDECRARFRHSAAAAGVTVASHPISAPGREGQRLTVDVAQIGAADPQRVLLVLSGVHGVEGFVGSALQCELLDRTNATELPDDVAVVLVHAVNPWGMSWWRRQNESNVDLNRNWGRDRMQPAANAAYDEIHPLACPDTPELPTVDTLMATLATVVADRGVDWVRDAITAGQYTQPDGLHFGGHRTEESTAIVERVVGDRLSGADRVLTVDLHTGHGPSGAVTFLSAAPLGSGQDEFLRARFVGERIEATVDNPSATTGPKSGQVATGVGRLLADAQCFGTTMEIGTASDDSQLVATYREQWVHRQGRREDPAFHDVVWAYRCCFTPDDRAWESQALASGARQLGHAVDAVTTWT